MEGKNTNTFSTASPTLATLACICASPGLRGCALQAASTHLLTWDTQPILECLGLHCILRLSGLHAAEHATGVGI